MVIVLAFALGTLAGLYLGAPSGYQDEAGFHYGKPER